MICESTIFYKYNLIYDNDALLYSLTNFVRFFFYLKFIYFYKYQYYQENNWTWRTEGKKQTLVQLRIG